MVRECVLGLEYPNQLRYTLSPLLRKRSDFLRAEVDGMWSEYRPSNHHSTDNQGRQCQPEKECLEPVHRDTLPRWVARPLLPLRRLRIRRQPGVRF